MAIKDGIRTLLLAQSSITTLAPAQTVGKKSIDAIFVDKIYQGFKPPYIMISRTGFDPRATLGTTTGIQETEIDIDCFAYTETLAEALAKAVSDYFKDYSGAAGGSDTIDSVEWDDINDFQNDEGNGGDCWRHAVTLSFTVLHH